MIVFQWPDKSLSPNARVHWAVRSGAAKRARHDGYVAAKMAGWDRMDWPEGRLHLWIDFYPPTRRLPDDDNMLARFKPVRDGIADAMGVDDKRFVSHPFVHTSPVKGGAVRVRITSSPEAA